MLKFVKPNQAVLEHLQTKQGYNRETIVKAGKNAKLPKTTEEYEVKVYLGRYKTRANASLKKIHELKEEEVALISKQIDRHHIKTKEIKKELNDATDEKRNDIQLKIAEMELIYSNLNTKRDAIKLQIENEEIFYKKICGLDRFSQAHNNQHEVTENNPTQHLNGHENKVVATTIKPNAINTVIGKNKPLEQTVAPPLIHDLLESSLFNRKKVNSQQSEVNSPIPEETVSTVSNPSFTDTQRVVNGNTGTTRMDLKQELTDALAKRKAKQDAKLAQIQELDSLMKSVAFQAAELQELDSVINSITFQEEELANKTAERWCLAPIPEECESAVTEEPDSSFFKRKTKTASLLVFEREEIEFEREEKLSNLNHS